MHWAITKKKMIIEIKAPVFPESIADGTIVAWHKQAGEAVRRGENLVDIETDKVVFDTPAPQSGVLQEIVCNEGETVTSGQVLARLDTSKVADEPEETVAALETASMEQAASMDAPILTPSARKLIAEKGLKDDEVMGSGKDGRVLKEDVLRFLARAGNEVSSESGEMESNVEEVPEQEPAAPSLPVASVPKSGPVVDLNTEGRPQKRAPMSRLRARVAERLLDAQHNAAILSTFNEINMQSVIDLRQRYRDRFQRIHGVRLGYMPFFVKATAEALKRFPEVNASIEGDDVVYHGFYDIGIAVGSPRGLVVPILRDADTLSMAGIEIQIKDFGERATDGSLSLEEISGGTFTITNGGVFGSLLSTPIINPPQSAILGMHKIEERPVAENGKVVIHPMMYVALSYDHCLIDGRIAVQFLATIKEILEDPARIVVGI